MKLFKQFREEAYFSVENLVLEGKGFGAYVKRRKKKRRQEKEKEMNAGSLSKREKKISKLASTKSHWRGLT
jgi:hypothetical protein